MDAGWLSLSALQPGMGALYVSGYTEDLVARQNLVEDGVLLVERPFAAEQLLAAVEEAPEFPVPQASPR